MEAAHIVPTAIGDIPAAYVFGLALGKGNEALWDRANGLLLHNHVQIAFDTAKLVIVPDVKAGDNEFQMVILDEELRDAELTIGGTFGDLEKQPLQFLTNARPDRRFLYFHCILSLFRRRRSLVPGWERDQTKLFTTEVWATPGPWLRRSLIGALALELGHVIRLEDMGVEPVGLANFANQLSEAEEADMALDIRAALDHMEQELEEDQ